MPDSKITALTSISTSTDPANDPLVIVDVSDTSMAATGTTKKVTLNQLLGASGTATLASATITGDLTVDTSTLKVNSSANRVGVLTASPESELDVRGLIAVRGTPTFPTTGVGPELFWSPGNSNSNLYSYNRGTSAWAEMAYGALSHVFQISGSEAMRLNSTGLGVGASPQVKLTVRTPHAVATATTYTGGLLIHDEANGIAPHLGAGIAYNGGDQISWIQSNSSTGVYPLALNPAGGEVRIGGNVGIGVTPSAWSQGKAIETGFLGNALWGAAQAQVIVSKNAYFNAGWKYAYTGATASNYEQGSGGHLWYTAPSGTAGNAITFTQAMTLDASGRLLVGTANASVTSETGCRLLLNNGATGHFTVAVTTNQSTAATSCYDFYSTSAAAYRFYVTSDGVINATNTTISAISDARLKENVQDIDVGLGAILALKPRKFDWKAGKGKDIKGDRGFIAQEFEQVFPNLIDEWKDPAPEGEAPYKSVRQDLIPVLVKAIQELAARVQTLETR